METKVRTVLGRQFRTEADYQAAQKDAAYIESIKKRYDLDNEEEVKQLLEDLKSGKYRFRTILGQDFKEETEEAYAGRKSVTAVKGGSRKGKTGSRKSKAEGRKSKAESTVRKRTAGTAGKKSTSLEDYDEDMRKFIIKELKKRERIRRLLISACMCVAAGCFLYLGIYYYQVRRLDAYAGKQQKLKGMETEVEITPETVVIHYDNQEIVVPDILEEYKMLYSLNQKLIGWVKIDDTYIDYPVLQTSNNDYYIDHNFDQEQDRNGSIFLDADCTILPRSTNLILYGHHMRSGRMFGQLNKYSSQSFYEEHKLIQFDTIYERGTYEVMYVFRSKVYEESEIVFKYYQFINAASETEFNSYMREMAAMSLYDTGVTAEYGDELLTLSTCDYYTDYGRFVVVAKKVK
ncbi:MAG: class B sortase [Lachnospiraceae bacterium]|nr:class B sortase [Lachnospiraceae bacterium]